MRPTFKHDDFQYGLEILLGRSRRGATDVGEVLATAARIKDGDADAWVREWEATGDAARAIAQSCDAAGRRRSALYAYLRAASYYSTALYLIAGAKAPEREQEIWRTHRACWDAAVDRFAVPGERIAIPYEDTTLAGYFFRAPDAQPGEPRPLVVMTNGSDGPTSGLWSDGGAAASERGYHWMTYDGPGQQAALYEQQIGFRPDWEAVLTPVLDAMLARPDVDPERTATIGISQAGYWVPRALAFEHRLRAAVVDPGVVDVSTSWIDPLPHALTKQLEAGEREKFDRQLRIGERFSHATKALLDFRGKPYMLASDSRFDLYQEVMRYRLGDELAQIDTPLLIANPEDEQFWPGQSRELYDRLPGERELVAFTAEEGANRHCEPMAPALREQRIYDWLDGQLA